MRALASDALHSEEASRRLFTDLVERLADLFEPVLCDEYAGLFSIALETATGLPAGIFEKHYRGARRVRAVGQESPKTVYVLSRVTLGADVAVTSLVLDAALRRFPASRIVFVGGRKNWELFSAVPGIELFEAGYARRGTLLERIAGWEKLREVMSEPDTVVLDTDSRLTQLGLLPVCPADQHYLFESRAYGRDGNEPLVELARRWCGEALGVDDTQAWIAPMHSPLRAAATVSLGVGENPAKRIGGRFEGELLRMLAEKYESVLVDTGAGGEEKERVLKAVDEAGAPNLRTWSGPFAPFADAIAKSRLYVGYDSAGQHVAAACGTPLLTIFAGYASERMFHRWYPSGKGTARVMRVKDPDPETVLGRVREELQGM
jgi:hypothetical protein